MKRKSRLLLLLVLSVVAGGAYAWLRQNLQPMPSGPEALVRWDQPLRLQSALEQLSAKGVVRDVTAAGFYASFRRTPAQIGTGTYKFRPGMTLDEVFAAMQKPLRQMVRIPETNWASRTSRLLEQKGVLKASEYMDLVKKPEEFKNDVSFPLPKDSLEGYLYPDTYDLPPLLGARQVILRQLRNFEKRVWVGMKEPKNLHRTIIIASMVEMEVARDEERDDVAGVIENRLKKGMRLQIDAAINYGMQKWRPLTYDDYRNVDSPYNLYRVDGLPPGPICSPTIKSIEAAIHPADHDHFFYVALPSGESLFSETYAEHLRNVKKRRDAVREAAKK